MFGKLHGMLRSRIQSLLCLHVRRTHNKHRIVGCPVMLSRLSIPRPLSLLHLEV